MKRIVYIKKCGYNDYARVTFDHKTSCHNYHWFIPKTIERISKYCFYKQKSENRHSVMSFEHDWLKFPDFWSGNCMYQQILRYGEEA